MICEPEFQLVINNLFEPNLKLRIWPISVREAMDYSIQHIQISYNPDINANNLTMPPSEDFVAGCNIAPNLVPMKSASQLDMAGFGVAVKYTAVDGNLNLVIEYREQRFLYEAFFFKKCGIVESVHEGYRVISAILKKLIELPVWDEIARESSKSKKYVDGAYVPTHPEGINSISLFIERGDEEEFSGTNLYKLADPSDREVFIAERKVRS